MLDGDLEKIYREEHPFYSPSFTPVMKALAAADGLTIKQIAAASSVSHSAASQTTSKLAKLGLIELVAGEDKRSRIVTLSDAGRDLLPWLRVRWAATQRAAASLESELSHPLGSLLSEAIAALESQPFEHRIRTATETIEGDAP